MTLTERVRESCGRVAREAKYVRVDAMRITDYACSLPLESLATPEIDSVHHYLGHGEDTVAYLLSLSTINFGSGYFPHLAKRPGMSGYFTVATAWKEHFERDGAPTALSLTRLTAAEVALILGQEMIDPAVVELMEHFARALADLGRWLADNYGGRYVGPVEAAGRSAERLAEILAGMPYFADVARYHGYEVAFYKRAQIAASDLALAFGGVGWGQFDDLARLTIFADNLVPHVLRVDGVLDYAASLARTIDRGELVAPGSEEEVEIRAGGVHACELIVQALRDEGRDVTAMQLDNLLWNRGQAPAYKQGRPRHRTRSVYY